MVNRAHTQERCAQTLTPRYTLWVRLRLQLFPKPTAGVAVLVDVWMAALVGHLLQREAREVWLVPGPRTAQLLAQTGDLLLGEQEGLPPEGFQYPASLKDSQSIDVAGKRVLLLAPDLVMALETLEPVQRVWLGGFRNAKALLRQLSQQPEVCLCALPDQQEPSLANALAAGFLAKRLLQNHSVGWSEGVRLATALLKAFPDPQEALFQSEAGQRLYRMGRTEDIALASLISVDDVVPNLREVRKLDHQQYKLSRDRLVFAFASNTEGYAAP